MVNRLNSILVWIGPLGVLFLVIALILPNFVGSQCGSGGTASIRGIMRTLQIAAEHHYEKTGRYPETLDQMMPFFPGGSETPNGFPGC